MSLMNFAKKAQATLIFSMWLEELQTALADKKLDDDEITELIIALIPVLQLYGLNINPTLQSATAKTMFEKIKAISTLSDNLSKVTN